LRPLLERHRVIQVSNHRLLQSHAQPGALSTAIDYQFLGSLLYLSQLIQQGRQNFKLQIIQFRRQISKLRRS
jgi:hypothetical protein